jgi:hypothetical protein
MTATQRVVRRSGSARSGNAVTRPEPARFPSPNAATSEAPALACEVRAGPSTTATTGSAPKLAALSVVATPTRRSGPLVTTSRSTLRTVRTSSAAAAGGPVPGSVRVTAAPSSAAAASVSNAASAVVADASMATSAGPSVPASPYVTASQPSARPPPAMPASRLLRPPVRSGPQAPAVTTDGVAIDGERRGM